MVWRSTLDWDAPGGAPSQVASGSLSKRKALKMSSFMRNIPISIKSLASFFYWTLHFLAKWAYIKNSIFRGDRDPCSDLTQINEISLGYLSHKMTIKASNFLSWCKTMIGLRDELPPQISRDQFNTQWLQPGPHADQTAEMVRIQTAFYFKGLIFSSESQNL